VLRSQHRVYDNYSIQFEDLLFDYSKNRITDETIVLLLNLAKARGLKGHIEDMQNVRDRKIYAFLVKHY
jgi:glucose-6-phosphate isomerase